MTKDLPIEWRPVKGYEQFYEVSNNGLVRSIDRIVLRNDGVYQKRRGKNLSPAKCRKGYLIVVLCNKEIGDNKTKKVHRVVAQAWIDNPNKLPEVNHLDGNKVNNWYSNLEWCTTKKNNEHAWDNGLMNASPGERNGCCKLTTDDIKKIRAEYVFKSKVYGGPALARKYGCSDSTIHEIIKKNIWKHI